MHPKNQYNNTQNRSARQRKNNGPCESKERCLEILTEEIEDLLPQEKWQDYEEL